MFCAQWPHFEVGFVGTMAGEADVPDFAFFPGL
jgi:hypothetical protein